MIRTKDDFGFFCEKFSGNPLLTGERFPHSSKRPPSKGPSILTLCPFHRTPAWALSPISSAYFAAHPDGTIGAEGSKACTLQRFPARSSTRIFHWANSAAYHRSRSPICQTKIISILITTSFGVHSVVHGEALLGGHSLQRERYEKATVAALVYSGYALFAIDLYAEEL
jgi:hypothetical protein